MSKKWKHVSYPDELNSPIVRNRLFVERAVKDKASEAEIAELEDLENTRISQLKWKRLNLLLDHYKIDTNLPKKWLALSLWLAHDHVPGMRVVSEPVRKKGRQRKTNEYAELLLTVDRIRAEENKKISEAIRAMVKRYPKPWGSFKGKERSLQVRYSELKRAQNSGNALNKTSHKNDATFFVTLFLLQKSRNSFFVR
jgi:hypothetical protein